MTLINVKNVKNLVKVKKIIKKKIKKSKKKILKKASKVDFLKNMKIFKKKPLKVRIFDLLKVAIAAVSYFARIVMASMVKTIEMRYFRQVSIALFILFLLINVSLYVKSFFVYSDSTFYDERQSEIIEIRVLDRGEVVDVDEVQIYERIVERGDTVLGFLFDIGLEENKIVDLLSAMKKKIDPRDIVIGNSLIAKYKIKYEHDNDEVVDKKVFLDEFRVVISPELEYKISKSEKGKFVAKKVVTELEKRVSKYQGTINEGLFLDATKVGASANAVMNLIALYGYDVDFQRDIRTGDEFEMVVESYYNKGGKRVKDGNVLFARLDLANKKDIAMYAHRMKNGSLQYFDKKGYSVKKSLLKTPINGARVSSRFGMRRHPVLGYSKLHKGVDFAARRGTPIFAAGDGIIVRRGRNGGYGNYIKIKHNSTYSTAYAHMSRFNRRFKRGSRVKQGDVIGYVGSTGRSTGPHLHFEVIKKGRAINPSRVKAVSGTRLKGNVLKSFKKTVEKIEKYRKNKG